MATCTLEKNGSFVAVHEKRIRNQYKSAIKSKDHVYLLSSPHPFFPHTASGVQPWQYKQDAHII